MQETARGCFSLALLHNCMLGNLILSNPVRFKFNANIKAIKSEFNELYICTQQRMKLLPCPVANMVYVILPVPTS